LGSRLINKRFRSIQRGPALLFGRELILACRNQQKGRFFFGKRGKRNRPGRKPGGACSKSKEQGVKSKGKRKREPFGVRAGRRLLKEQRAGSKEQREEEEGAVRG
jgi:hypothetical protein